MSKVAELTTAITFLMLGCAILVKRNTKTSNLVRDRMVIALTGINVTSIIFSFFVTHGFTNKVVVSQILNFIILGILIFWYIRCSKATNQN